MVFLSLVRILVPAALLAFVAAAPVARAAEPIKLDDWLLVCEAAAPAAETKGAKDAAKAAAKTKDAAKAKDAAKGLKAKDGKKKDLAKDGDKCALVQELTTAAEGGQRGRLIRIVIRPWAEAKGQYLMMALLPLGIHIPTGVQIKIDEGQQVPMIMQSCTQAGCEAAILLKDGLLAEVKKGATLRVGFKGAPNAQTLIVPVSLKGISLGLGAL